MSEFRPIAGGDLGMLAKIVATDGGADSNIGAVGSTIGAGNIVNLAADNAIRLKTSQNNWEQHGITSEQ